MKPLGQVSRSPFADFPCSGVRGVTLLESSLVLVAVALAAVIGTQEIRGYRHRAMRDQMVEQIRELGSVFEKYHAEKGEWPAATNPDMRVPRGLETALASTAWSIGSPLGGLYEWLPPGPVVRPIEALPTDLANAVARSGPKEPIKAPVPSGTIAITGFSSGPALDLSSEDLRYIDSKLDDGNLTTGRFRSGFNRWPVYFVAPSH